MQLLISIFCYLCCSQVFAVTEPMSLNFHLQQSKRIETIRILSYEENAMIYVNLKGDTLKINCDTRSIQLNLNDHEKDLLQFRESGKAIDWVNWPKAGEQLIMVTDLKGNVDLFAYEIGKHFAFWSPNSIPYSGHYFVGIDIEPFIGELDGKQVEFKQATIFLGHNLVRIKRVQKTVQTHQSCGRKYAWYSLIGVFLFICLNATFNAGITKA